MIHWLRYGKPRYYVLVFSSWLPVDSWLRVKMLDWLYPPDCIITFK